MSSQRLPEFKYSSIQLPPQEPSPGEYTPIMGDFSIRHVRQLFKSGYPTELDLLSIQEKKAYDLRWGMKGHPRLFFMVGRVLGCNEQEAHMRMQEISLKVRYYKRLCPN